ncbi:hypothetical protein BH10ACT9_BH10ACT9_18060 [soil metagenome]
MATTGGHLHALAWARTTLGDDLLWGIEDCRNLSARLERDLLSAGQKVVRVAPKLMAAQRATARTWGKSDPIDALAVAQAVLRHPDLPVAAHDEVSCGPDPRQPTEIHSGRAWFALRHADLATHAVVFYRVDRPTLWFEEPAVDGAPRQSGQGCLIAEKGDRTWCLEQRSAEAVEYPGCGVIEAIEDSHPPRTDVLTARGGQENPRTTQSPGGSSIVCHVFPSGALFARSDRVYWRPSGPV